MINFSVAETLYSAGMSALDVSAPNKRIIW